MTTTDFRKDLECFVMSGRKVTSDSCFEASKQHSNQLRFCLPKRCQSPYRICISCLAQEKISKYDRRNKSSILVGDSGNGYGFCRFHGDYGPEITREGEIQPISANLWRLIFGKSKSETGNLFKKYELKEPVYEQYIIKTAADFIREQSVSQETKFNERKISDFPNFIELSRAMREEAEKMNFSEFCPVNFKAKKIAELFSCASFLAEILLPESNNWLIKWMGPSVPQKERISAQVAFNIIKFSLQKQIELAGECAGKEIKICAETLRKEFLNIRNRAYYVRNYPKVKLPASLPKASEPVLLNESAPSETTTLLSLLPQETPDINFRIELTTVEEGLVDKKIEFDKKNKEKEEEETMVKERTKRLTAEEKEELKREIFLLREQGKPDLQIAKKLGIKVSWIYNQFPRGKHSSSPGKKSPASKKPLVAKQESTAPEQQSDSNIRALMDLVALPAKVVALEAKVEKATEVAKGLLDMLLDSVGEKMDNGRSMMDEAKKDIELLEELRRVFRGEE